MASSWSPTCLASAKTCVRRLSCFHPEQACSLYSRGKHDWIGMRYWLLNVTQEHIYVPTAFELKEGLESWDELQNPQRLEEEIKK